MLDVFEIKNLEERWKKYRRKKNIKIFILIFMPVAVVLISVYYFALFSKKDTVSKHTKSTHIVKKENIKVDKKPKVLSKVIKKTNSEKNITKSNVAIPNKDKKNNYNIKSVDILHLDKKFLQQVYLDNSEENKTNINNLPLVNGNESIEKEKIEQKDKKEKIIISSKKIDKLKYFKEQYKQNPRALYAILIAKEYYKNKSYNKSLKWAMIANSLDSSNEKSWILFAKNKVKLHQKNDALNALQAYLRVNSSKKIEILLSNIKNGVFK